MNIFKKIVTFIITWEAKLVLQKYKPKIIAVTGSVGKTTTKDAIFTAVSSLGHVRKSEKSFNSDIGVPLTILGLENAWRNPLLWIENSIVGLWLIVVKSEYPTWLVLEVGADRPGDIRTIAQWLRPDVVVITGVPEVPVHVEFFDSPEAVVKEKRALAEYLRPGGKLILNYDDARMRAVQTDFRGASITYGLEGEPDYIATHAEYLYGGGKPIGMRFRINYEGSSVPVSIFGALGVPRMYASLAAVAVAKAIGVDAVTAGSALASWMPPPGRMRIIDGVRSSTILDDTYNSSPTAALSALDALNTVGTPGRRIAVMGDMMELGKFSVESHKQVGIRAAAVCDMLITVGFRSRALAESAIDAGMLESNVLQYEHNESSRAGLELEKIIKEGDVVLVKGSQSMRMERAVFALMNDKMKAHELLVRQDPAWQIR